MGAIIIITVGIPAAQAAWPLIAAAAMAAAGSLGFAAAKTGQKVKAMMEVDLTVENAEEVAGGLARQEELTFTKGDVQVTFARDINGKISLKVRGAGKTREELQTLGQHLAQGLVQQYAYHRLMTEIKNRDMTVIDQEVEADGTVRLRVRTYQG